MQIVNNIEDLSDPEGLLKLNIQISTTYQDKQEYSKSMQYAENALEIQRKTGNKEFESKIYFNIAYGAHWLNNYNKALEYYELNLKSLDENDLEDKRHQGVVYGRLAAIYKDLGKYEKSYDNQLQSLQVAETLKDTANIGTAIYQLGSLFYYQKQYDKALEYYQKAQPFTEKTPRMAYACLAAIGTSYESLNQFERSLEYNKRSLDKAYELDYKTGVAYSLSNIGSTYISLKQYDKAIDYIVRALVLKKELKDKWGVTGTLRHLADLLIKTGKPEKAIPHLEEALAIAEEIQSKPRKLEIYQFFSVAYKEIGDFEQSLYFIEEYATLKDSVLNEKTVEQMGALQESYEVEKKESEILLLKKDNEVLEAQQELDELYNFLWIGAAILLGLLLLLFFNRYKTQKKSSLLLAEKNKQINKQNDELQKVNELISKTNQLLEQNKLKIEEQNKALESSNEDLRNFASVASHDLKEPLRMINAYTSILKKKYEGLFDERAHEFMGFVVDGVTRMEQLINSLLDYSRVSLNGGKEKYKLLKLSDVVEIVKGNLRFPIIKNSATVMMENEEDFPIVRADQVQMIQLIQNLVSNAMKFTGDKLPVVIIGFKTEGDFHTFYIKDNGIGISPENQVKIFDMLTRLHTKQEYEGTGIGLATVRKIVERHQGKIWVESVEGEGSTFFFTMPVVKEAEPVMA